MLMDIKFTFLNSILERYRSSVLAFSGGVASTFQARIAKDVHRDNLL
jgi:PP-loop superfamily ATP-utilizing enzyme